MSDTTSSSAELVAPTPPLFDEARIAVAGFLARYSGGIRVAYTKDLRMWLTWCASHGLNVLDAQRPHLGLWARDMEEHQLLARATIGRRLSTVAGRYRFAVIDGKLERSPADCVRRPHISGESTTLGLDRMELGAFIDQAANERDQGPLLLMRSGRRMDRHGATRIVRRLAKRAGITKHVSPHSLRHSFITAALDAGVPLPDVQIAARHADPRTTTRYDRARENLDRHASYIVTAFIAGAARPRQHRLYPAFCVGARQGRPAPEELIEGVRRAGSHHDKDDDEAE